MDEIKINKIKTELPTWDLSEIYEDIENLEMVHHY